MYKIMSPYKKINKPFDTIAINVERIVLILNWKKTLDNDNIILHNNTIYPAVD